MAKYPVWKWPISQKKSKLKLHYDLICFHNQVAEVDKVIGPLAKTAHYESEMAIYLWFTISISKFESFLGEIMILV